MDYRKPFDTASPEAVGIRSEDIQSYLDALEASQTEMHGLMIMRHGKLCAEGWWAPFGPNVRHGLQSHTKTYAATAVGIAYTEGLIRLDERVIDIFPEDAPENPSENLKLLTHAIDDEGRVTAEEICKCDDVAEHSHRSESADTEHSGQLAAHLDTADAQKQEHRERYR